MILGHSIALDPTEAQEAYFRRACGTARYAYNWALAEWKRMHEAGEKPSAMKVKATWNAHRKANLPWTYEVTKCAATQRAAMMVNIDRAAHDKMVRERGEVPPLVDMVARSICKSRSCNGFECCENAGASSRHKCPVDRGGYDDAAAMAIAAVRAVMFRPALDAEYGPERKP